MHGRAGRLVATLVGMAMALTILPGAGRATATGRHAFVRLAGQMAPQVVSDKARLLHRHGPGWPISVDLGLPLRHQAQLLGILNRGRRVPPARFQARYAPKQRQVRAVRAWAIHQGMTITFNDPQGITEVAQAPTRVMERAFHVRINDYRGPGGHVYYSVDRPPRVPSRLGLVAIAGLNTQVSFGTEHQVASAGRGSIDRVEGRKAAATLPAGVRTGGFFPKDFRRMYANDYADTSTQPATTYDGHGETIDLVLWGGAMPNSTLATFAKQTGDQAMTSCLHPSATAANDCTGHTLFQPDQIEWQYVNCVGAAACAANHPMTDGSVQGEIAMDAEYAHAMAPHSHLKYFLADCAGAPATTMAGNDSCGFDDAGMLAAMRAAGTDPSIDAGFVVSNSWGGPEPDPTTMNGACGALPDAFACQTEPILLAARNAGITFYFATHDSASNSGGTTLPSYPADSPSAVSVGGTALYGTPDNKGTYNYAVEQAWGTDLRGTGGGGGCSSVFARPPWQTGVQPVSLNGAACPGRATPDISADGAADTGAYVLQTHNTIDNHGNITGTLTTHAQIGGTSLSTPLIAGMMAVTDEFLSSPNQQCGQSPCTAVGWAGAKIYTKLTTDAGSPSPNRYNAYFNDVTCGNNGFAARPGWDEATGWGTPKWLAFSKGLGGIAVSPAAASVSSWHCANDSTTAFDLLGTACPIRGSPPNCIAVAQAGRILTTADPAKTWTTVTTDDLTGVSCPTATTCFAVGDQGLIFGTTNGGMTWRRQASGPNHLNGISCPTAQECYAVGNRALVMRTTDGGTTWTQIPLGSGNFWLDLRAVSCPDAADCYAVGSGTYVAGQGTAEFSSSNAADANPTWLSHAKTMPVTGQLNGISCSGPTTCVAVGDAGVVVNGTNLAAAPNWAIQADPLQGVAGATAPNLQAVSCPVGGPTCTGAGDTHGPDGNPNNEGTILSIPAAGGPAVVRHSGLVGDQITGVSCPNANDCKAVALGDGQAITTGDGGTNWAPQPLTSWLALRAVSCFDAQHCFAVGKDTTLAAPAVIYGWNGAAWSYNWSYPAVDLHGIACPGASTCYAVGDRGNIWKTTNIGATWTPAPPPANPAPPVVRDNLHAIACTSLTTCIAVGQCASAGCPAGHHGATTLVTTDGGATWNLKANPLTNVTGAGLNGITCPSDTNRVCYAVGSAGSILSTVDSGSTWSKVTNPVPVSVTLNAVSCLDGANCYVVGSNGAIYKTDNAGGAWTNETKAAVTTSNLLTVSCVDATHCYAGGGLGTIVKTTDGTAWTVDPSPISGSRMQVSGIDCLTATRCVAVGGDPGVAGLAMIGPGLVLTLG